MWSGDPGKTEIISLDLPTIDIDILIQQYCVCDSVQLVVVQSMCEYNRCIIQQKYTGDRKPVVVVTISLPGPPHSESQEPEPHISDNNNCGERDELGVGEDDGGSPQ